MKLNVTSKVLTTIVVFAAIAFSAKSADAQYFGRNKVQYREFDFKILETEHFDIYYYEEEAQAAQLIGRMAERWYARLSRLLDHELNERQPIIMYANHPDFEQTNAIGGNLTEGTGGVTEVFKRRIVLPFAGPMAETDHVLGHELVHAFQFDITGSGQIGVNNGIPNALGMPLWFIEGMAEYLSVGPIDPHTSMWIRDASVNTLPTLDDLANPRRFFPYRYGQALWSFLAGWYGDEVVGRMLKASRTSRDAVQAMYKVIGNGVNTVSERWHASINDSYADLQEQTNPVSDYGRVILSEETGSGDINIAPSLSPDGTKIVFLSEKDFFSIELYLADTESGEIIRKLTESVSNPHLESLEFINSAGTWSPDSRYFAFGSVRTGRAALSIIDTETGQSFAEHEFDDVGEILNPSWSPDGRTIVFTALVGGFSDLYTYELESRTLNRLTDDVFADLQPSWSPDGTTIAFVTDRFDSNEELLQFGVYRLASMDPATGFISRLPSFEIGKNINPQWSPDGKSLFFISNRDGISNLYRADLATEDIFQVTNIFTGLTGITSLSPALSVARGTGEVAFSVYEDGAYNIYLADSDSVLVGTTPNNNFNVSIVATLPPSDRLTDDVLAVLADAESGLADYSTFSQTEYRPTLGLDYIAQPYLIAGSSRFGTFVGGGAALFWSDMLGERNLTTQFQINGGLKDISATVAYQNKRHRWDYGAVVQQTPFVSGFLNRFYAIDPTTGNQILVESLEKFRQTNREILGFTSFSFNRSQRVEFSLGYRNIFFEREIKQRFFNAITFQEVLAPLDSSAAIGDPLHLLQGTAALVYDNSVFGLTGPIMGQRYRLELTPFAGSLNYVNVTADIRKYFVPMSPFTIATRIVHSGRYGSDGEDPLLNDFYIGYSSLVRGYDFNSFDVFDCTAPDALFSTANCSLGAELFGSRLLVGNLELRFPLFGVLGAGSGYYGFLPIDFIVFGDAGMAWSTDDPLTPNDNEQAFFLGGDRKPVYSAGAGMRMNLFGFAIIEFDRVRAFNRGDGGKWLWQFSFNQGL